MIGTQYSAPDSQSPAGQFFIQPSTPQFGAVDYGDGAGPVPTHLALLFVLSAQQGATINEALLTITNGPAGSSPAGIAYVEAVDNAVAPTTAQDAMDRVFDSADQVAFTMQGGANAVTTVNLTNAIQTLVNRGAWSPWGRCQIHLRCNASQPGFCSPALNPTFQIVASTADPTLTFAEQMVQKLEAALLANPTAQSITIGGVTTSFADVQKRLSYFYGQCAKEQGERATFTGINLARFRA